MLEVNTPSFFELFLSTMQTSILIVNDEGTIQFANTAICNLLDYKKKELISQHVSILIPKRFHLKHKQHFSEYFQAPNVRDLSAKKKLFISSSSHVEIPVKICLTPITTNNERHVICEVIDITTNVLIEEVLQEKALKAALTLNKEIEQHNQIEQALRESEKHYRTLTSMAQVGIFHNNAQGACTYMNERAYEISGVSPGCGLGDGWSEGLHPDDRERVMSEWKHACKTIAPHFTSEFRFLHADGKVVHGLSLIMAVKAEEAKTLSYVGTITDVTELKEACAQVEQLRTQLAHFARLQLGQELASSLAHELNQPLSAIVQYAGGCIEHLKKTQTSDSVCDALNSIMAQAEHVGKIIHHFKEFMRKGKHEFTLQDINTLVYDSIELMDHELQNANVKRRLIFSDNLPHIHIDKIHIQQVLVNITNNAVEALLETDAIERIITITTKKTDKHSLEIVIANTGPGIPEKILASVFNPFFTTKEDGMGIGLSLSRSIIEAHCGHIDVISDLQNGTKFKIVLPINNEKKPA